MSPVRPVTVTAALRSSTVLTCGTGAAKPTFARPDAWSVLCCVCGIGARPTALPGYRAGRLGRVDPVGFDPDERGSQADRGPIVAGEFVGAHRDPAPLFELVEAALDDVSTLVPLLLLGAEIDRPALLLPAVRNLIVTLRDGRRDPSRSQPCAVRFRRVSLVRQHTVGPSPRPPQSVAGHADVIEGGGEHGGVGSVAAGEDHAQRSAAPIGDQMHLCRQPAAGATDGVIKRLDSRILVIRHIPL